MLTIAVLTLANVCSAQVKTQPQDIIASQQKRRKAEQVVVRAMRRFGQTLDFNDIYREMYVKDKSVRQSEIKFLINNFADDVVVDKEVLEKLNKAVLEKTFFLKNNNNLWLFMLCISEKGTGLDYFENVVVRKLNRRQRIIYERFTNDKSEHSLISKAEVFNALSMLDVVSSVLRKYLTAKFRKNIQTKATIHLFREISPPKDKSYVSKYKNFYEITVDINGEWIPISFTVVEELGVMRILSAKSILD